MTQTIPLGADARERFVLEIAKVLAPERIVEAHLFAPLRQGQIETGVCVLAALPEGADPLPANSGQPEDSAEQSGTAARPDSRASEITDNGLTPYQVAEPSPGADAPAQGDTLLSENAERLDATSGTDAAEAVEAVEDVKAVEAADATAAAFPEGARISSRHVVYSARYRWTRKGPERGKWECEVVAEADAPLLTVEAVVQGVQHRSSEPLEVQKLDGDTVRSMIAQAQQQWQKTA